MKESFRSQPEYFVRFREHRYETSPPEEPPESGSPYYWQGGSAVDVTLRGIYLSNDHAQGMDVERIRDAGERSDALKVGEFAHVVLVVYEDGSTFGREGYWTVWAVKRDASDAHQIAEECEQPRKDERYRPWDGYFASLTSVEVVTLPVQP